MSDDWMWPEIAIVVLQLVATVAATWAAFSARESAAASEAAILQTERITAEERVRTQRYMVQSHTCSGSTPLLPHWRAS